MSYAFGRRNNPAWDALRVQSLNRLGGLVSDNQTPGALGGLTNSIYVWHADGTDLAIYDPDQAGLNSAIGVAATGDTIWLPSVPIALTAGITIPANVALRGISLDAILSFSGFSGAAITMAANAVCDHFTFTYTPSGNNSIGLDARFSGAIVNHVRGSILGSATGCVGVYAGA